MSRYDLKKSTILAGWWTCLDTETGLELMFEEGKFNDSQRAVVNDEAKARRMSPVEIARAMREMGDWIKENHYKLMFGAPDPAESRRELGRILAEHRQDQGLSVRQLADKCGIHYSTISQIENGRQNASLDVIVKIANALDLILTVK